MSQALIDELKRENLCTYFVLPLLKLNKGSFTASGFINCYLTSDLKRLAVKISDVILLPRKVTMHPEYSVTYRDDNGCYLVMFRLRSKWQKDVLLFSKGKYSRMSTTAKEAIIRFSGLPYHRLEDGKVVTDGRLLALEKHKVLRGMWEREMFTQTGKRLDDPDQFLPDELLSIPGEESYINPEGLARIRETQL